MNRLAQSASDKGFDYLGTSFGATSGLLSFWQNSGYLPVRTGLQREAASGCYSLMMLQGSFGGGQRTAGGSPFPLLRQPPVAAARKP